MVVSEIVRTCTHAKVAEAAVASIGRDFSTKVSEAADRWGVPPGAFAARVVREFGERAGEVQKRAIERAVRQADMPVLKGLRLILEDAMERVPH